MLQAMDNMQVAMKLAKPKPPIPIPIWMMNNNQISRLVDGCLTSIDE